MKIVLLPLDERPCNYLYPQELPLGEEIVLVLPPIELLSEKKKVCDISKLHEWLVKECKDADYALLSLDMLLYGGIVPSRLHHDSVATLKKRSEILQVLKQNNPKLKIYVNELIMRTPSYSNAIEEPDYFDEYGRELWQYGCYLDKDKQGLLTFKEKIDMDVLAKKIPGEYLKDLMDRREVNKQAIMNNLKYLLDGVIDYFVIPQDDCAPYGFTSIDRREINAYLEKAGLDKVVRTYPGADEAGMVLISRALNNYYKKTPKVFVKYADESKKEVVPDYEDRKIDISISQHILNIGGERTDSYNDADMVLGVNLTSLGEKKKSQLNDFVSFLMHAKKDDKIVGISDVLICNRGDIDLYNKLREENALKVIDAYAGWNTASNSTGTVITNMTAYYYSKNVEKKSLSLFCQYLEAILYMGIIRDELSTQALNDPEISIGNIEPKLDEIMRYTYGRLINEIDLRGLNKVYDFKDIKIFFPWKRVFEIGVVVK